MKNKIDTSINPFVWPLVHNVDSESLIRSILDKAERYIFGSPEDVFFSFLVENELNKSRKKGPRSQLEVWTKELTEKRDKIIGYKKKDLAKYLDLFSDYTSNLIPLARHYALLDPVIIKYIDILVRLSERRSLSISTRTELKDLLSLLFLKLLPNLNKEKSITVDPKKLHVEYKDGMKKVKEIVKLRSAENRRNKLKAIFPDLSESTWGDLSKNTKASEVVSDALTAKYGIASTRIRELSTKGKSEIKHINEMRRIAYDVTLLAAEM